MAEKNPILVVDDNPDSSALVEKILIHSGHSVFIAEDGPSALEYCKNHHPSLIFIDLSLPGMDGLEVTKELRSKEAFTNVPIIALTGHSLPEVEEETKKAGCTAYLSKPFMPNEIIDISKKYLEGSP